MNTVSTKSILLEAFISVGKNKPYDKISVSDIVKECNASRTTFYNHFRDKEDLVIWAFKESLLSCYPDEGEVLGFDEVMLRFLESTKKASELMGITSDYHGQNSLAEYLQKVSVAFQENSLKKSLDISKLDRNMHTFVEFYAAGGIRLFQMWLYEDCAVPGKTFLDDYRRICPDYLVMTHKREFSALELIMLFESVYQENR